MIQAIMRYLCGYVKIRIRGTSPERFLNLCRYHQILIWGLSPKEDSYEMYVTLQGFRRLRPIIRKTHTKVILRKRYGLPFFLHRHRKRKAFLFGALLCIGLLYFYSSYIWDIHFEGNEKWTDQTLLAFLDTKEVSPCMPKKEIDCPQIVKEIRAQYDDIVWVSASIDGSRLKIQIKENEDTFQGFDTPAATGTKDGTEEGVQAQENTASEAETKETGQEEEKPTDLIASQDGVITRMITRSGVPVVHAGDTVKKGDLLVSGRVEVLNDAKEVIGYQYQQSDADIFADTQMEYEEEMSVFYQEKIYRKREQRHLFYLKLGSFQISLGTIKHPFKKWETYTEEHQIKLGENFYLPASYGRISVKSYDTKQKKYANRQLQEMLTERFTHFSEELEEKGIQIYENSVRIHVYEKSAVAKGTLYLNQRITEAADTEILTVERNEQDEPIGTDHGNTGGT